MTDPTELFAGAARLAAPVLDFQLEGAPAGLPQDPFAARHALYWFTANLSAREPLAILVDDAHWADDASLGVLAHIANRLEGLPVALVTTCRSEESSPAIDTMRRQAGDAGTLLSPSPLGEQAAAAVVRSFAPSAGDDLCRACHRASGGNPFLLHELARSLRDAPGTPPDPARVLDQSPDRVTREIAGRLARLPEAATRLAHNAAVLGDGVPLRQAAALAEIPHDDALDAADALVTAGFLGSAQPLEFLHPLIPPPSTTPRDRPRDRWSTRAPLTCSSTTVRRPNASRRSCCARSRPPSRGWSSSSWPRLTWPGHGGRRTRPPATCSALDEPPPSAQRARIALQLGAAQSVGGDSESAIAHLREALEGELEAEQRLLATRLLAARLAQSHRPAEAADLIEGQLEVLADRPDLCATAEAALVNVTRPYETRPRAAPVIERLRRGSRTKTSATRRPQRGCDRDGDGRGARRSDGSGRPAGAGGIRLESHELGLVWLPRRPRARARRGLRRRPPRTGQRRRSGARAGAAIELGGALAFRAELNLLLGDLANAEVDARTVLEIAAGSGGHAAEAFAVTWLTEALVERGELEEAEAVLERDATEVQATRVYATAQLLLARGRLRVAQGRVDEGIEALRESGRWSVETDVFNPASGAWRSELAHALAGDRPDEGGATPGGRGARARPPRGRPAHARRRAARRRARRGRREGDQDAARGDRRARAHRRSSSAPRRTPRWARRCARRSTPPRRASRSAWRSTLPASAARGPSRSGRSRRCARPGPAAPAGGDRGGGPDRQRAAHRRAGRRRPPQP